MPDEARLRAMTAGFVPRRAVPAVQVEAQSGKDLTTTEAALLLQSLTLIRGELGCA